MSRRSRAVITGGWRAWFIHVGLWLALGLSVWFGTGRSELGSLWWWFLWVFVLMKHAVQISSQTVREVSGMRVSRTGSRHREMQSLPAEIREVLGALRESAPEDLDLEGLVGAAIALVSRRKELESSVDPELCARLEMELAETLTRKSEETDLANQSVLTAQIEAIEDRLSNIQAATQIATRLQARERTLLHQLEDLRLTVLRQATAVGEANCGPSERIQELRHELEAETEIEEALSRARIEMKSQLRT